MCDNSFALHFPAYHMHATHFASTSPSFATNHVANCYMQYSGEIEIIKFLLRCVKVSDGGLACKLTPVRLPLVCSAATTQTSFSALPSPQPFKCF